MNLRLIRLHSIVPADLVAPEHLYQPRFTMADAAGGKDCVLHCDGGNTQLAVHSTILKLWSPVLRGALETGSELELGGGSPATPPACTMTHLPLPQDSAADWSVVLSLIYPPTRSPRPAITWVSSGTQQIERVQPASSTHT